MILVANILAFLEILMKYRHFWETMTMHKITITIINKNIDKDFLKILIWLPKAAYCLVFKRRICVFPRYGLFLEFAILAASTRSSVAFFFFIFTALDSTWEMLIRKEVDKGILPFLIKAFEWSRPTPL